MVTHFFFLGRMVRSPSHLDPSPLHRNRRRPPGHHEIPRRDEEWRPPPPFSPRWCPPGARWCLVSHHRCSSGLLRVVAHGSLTVYLCARSLLRRWWYSSPTSVISPPPEPSSRGSSSMEPYSPTPPASTTAAMVPPAAADPRILWAAS